jgi:two-component system, OmpR family, alkaline phosphatase synthesis response regulator PhoP
MNVAKRILIVDDDVAFAESNRDLLEAFGYEVYTAQDGASGLQLARQIRPDLMILDVMMATETEGFEVARRIPESPELKNMGVLLVTGVMQALHLPRGLQPDDTWLPVDRVLEKPIAPDRLMHEVERILKEKARGTA